MGNVCTLGLHDTVVDVDKNSPVTSPGTGLIKADNIDFAEVPKRDIASPWNFGMVENETERKNTCSGQESEQMSSPIVREIDEKNRHDKLLTDEEDEVSSSVNIVYAYENSTIEITDTQHSDSSIISEDAVSSSIIYQGNRNKLERLWQDLSTVVQMESEYFSNTYTAKDQTEIELSTDSKSSVELLSPACIDQKNAKSSQQLAQDQVAEKARLNNDVWMQKTRDFKENKIIKPDGSFTLEEKWSLDITSQKENKQKQEVLHVAAEGTRFKNRLAATEKVVIEKNNSLAVSCFKESDEISLMKISNQEHKNSLEQQLQEQEVEVIRLEKELLLKKKRVEKQNETLAQLREQKVKRNRDLKNEESRKANISLQTQLRKPELIVARQNREEEIFKTVTIIEGRLLKFGKSGKTYPKEKWVHVRRFAEGQVILDYGEVFFSEKLKRNEIQSVKRGEKYLSGKSSSYEGRVIAIQTKSPGKKKHMVFAVSSVELCRHWFESIKAALINQ